MIPSAGHLPGSHRIVRSNCRKPHRSDVDRVGGTKTYLVGEAPLPALSDTASTCFACMQMQQRHITCVCLVPLVSSWLRKGSWILLPQNRAKPTKSYQELKYSRYCPRLIFFLENTVRGPWGVVYSIIRRNTEEYMTANTG